MNPKIKISILLLLLVMPILHWLLESISRSQVDRYRSSVPVDFFDAVRAEHNSRIMNREKMDEYRRLVAKMPECVLENEDAIKHIFPNGYPGGVPEDTDLKVVKEGDNLWVSIHWERYYLFSSAYLDEKWNDLTGYSRMYTVQKKTMTVYMYLGYVFWFLFAVAVIELARIFAIPWMRGLRKKTAPLGIPVE